MTDHSHYLSGVVITYNEAEKITDCLKSLSMITDEIVVVDSYSSDNTPDICQNFGVRFYQHPYSGQIQQKQYALSLTKHDYVIALDGDEVLNEDLIRAIQIEKQKGFPCDGYSFNRYSFYCGKWIKYGDWFPDWKLRLWKKDKAWWGGINPHDRVMLHSGKPRKLNGLICHYTFQSRSEHLSQIKNYAEISANSYLKQGKKFIIIRMLFSPVFFFFKHFLLKKGFMDGKLGWQITKLGMLEKWMKYKRLYALKTQRSTP